MLSMVTISFLPLTSSIDITGIPNFLPACIVFSNDDDDDNDDNDDDNDDSDDKGRVIYLNKMDEQ